MQFTIITEKWFGGGIFGENDPRGEKKHDSSRNCKKATLIRAQKVKEGIVKIDMRERHGPVFVFCVF